MNVEFKSFPIIFVEIHSSVKAINEQGCLNLDNNIIDSSHIVTHKCLIHSIENWGNQNDCQNHCQTSIGNRIAIINNFLTKKAERLKCNKNDATNTSCISNSFEYLVVNLRNANIHLQIISLTSNIKRIAHLNAIADIQMKQGLYEHEWLTFKLNTIDNGSEHLPHNNKNPNNNKSNQSMMLNSGSKRSMDVTQKITNQYDQRNAIVGCCMQTKSFYTLPHTFGYPACHVIDKLSLSQHEYDNSTSSNTKHDKYNMSYMKNLGANCSPNNTLNNKIIDDCCLPTGRQSKKCQRWMASSTNISIQQIIKLMMLLLLTLNTMPVFCSGEFICIFFFHLQTVEDFTFILEDCVIWISHQMFHF